MPTLRVSIADSIVAGKLVALSQIKQCTVDALVTAYLERDLAAVPLAIIAAQDAIAFKPIDHHVAAVRRILGATSALDSAAIARALGVSLPTCTKVLKHMLGRGLVTCARQRRANGTRATLHYTLRAAPDEELAARQRTLQECRDAVAAQPTPKPPVSLEGVRAGSALERNGALLYDLLMAHPEGLTVRAVGDITGWCRLTSERVLHYLFNAGRAVRERSATGGAPAWCYNAVSNAARKEPEESEVDYDMPAPACAPTPEQRSAAQAALRSLGIDPTPDDELPPLGG